MAQRAIAETAVPAGEARAARPIDLVHLARQCLGDENLELEILRLFDKTLTTYFERLTLASTFDDLALNLHAIKGAAAGVGAWGIVDLAKSLEDDLRDARPLKAERVADLGMAVEEVRGFIARMLTDKAE